MKIGVFAATEIGLQVVEIFREKGRRIDYLVLNKKESPSVRAAILKLADAGQIIDHDAVVEKIPKGAFDLGLLCWWPYLIKDQILGLSVSGFLNFHPSYLPYNRGKHPNFWSIVEDTPFGVTIHWIDHTIDGGNIAFQKTISKGWEDNGKTLYDRARKEIVSLFRENFDRIIEGNIPCIPQGTGHRVHLAREIDLASRIDLEKDYRAKVLLNLLRARTFEGYPACHFSEDGREYEVRVEIHEVQKN